MEVIRNLQKKKAASNRISNEAMDAIFEASSKELVELYRQLSL